MDNLFHTQPNVEDLAKVDMDELYEQKRQADLLKLNTYKTVLSRIHTRIKVTSRQRNNEQCCWFVVPEVILGSPSYDVQSCIVYITNELKDNGFLVKYTHPNLLFISWKHYIPGYVRTEFKKQTGVAIDEHGNKIIKNKKDESENTVQGLLVNRGKKQTQQQQQQAKDKNKDYKSIGSYRPTGKLIYNEDLLETVQNKFTT
tara:strand:+ start:348 stop:950 length:603 start_codon:yes stop_codon:yes gene_type:complete